MNIKDLTTNANELLFYKQILFGIILVLGIIEMIFIITKKHSVNKKEFQTTSLGLIFLLFMSFVNSTVFVNLNILIISEWVSHYLSYPFSLNWYWWLYGLFAYEFFYWLQHFLAHKVRLLWCFHSPHHSPKEMNLFVGFNHSFIESLFIRPFFVGLLPVLIGVNPIIIITWNIVDTVWGCFLHISNHTLKGKLGLLEYFLQTPSHHRVHHSTYLSYLDTNFTSITLFWDYFFGTFQSSNDEIKIFGTSRKIDTENFLVVHFGELTFLWKDIINANSLRDKLLYIIMPPGWTHTGKIKTVAELKKTENILPNRSLFKNNILIVALLINLHDKFLFNPKLKRCYNLHCPSPNFVIDVGSNKGQSIDFFLGLNANCKVVAFEPNPDLYEELIKKYIRNCNIMIFKLGISNTSGKKVFYETLLNTTSSFERINYMSDYVKKKSKILGINPNLIVSKTYEVETVTLSKFIIDSKITDDIDIIKIDTEGHEYHCLSGLFSEKIENKIKFIQVENHTNDQYHSKIGFSEIEKLLKINNFSISTKISHVIGDFHDHIYSYEKDFSKG